MRLLTRNKVWSMFTSHDHVLASYSPTADLWTQLKSPSTDPHDSKMNLTCINIEVVLS